MIGVNAYNCTGFHPACRVKGHVTVLDVAGKPYLWCQCCGVLADLQAVSVKYGDYKVAVKGVV